MKKRKKPWRGSRYEKGGRARRKKKKKEKEEEREGGE